MTLNWKGISTLAMCAGMATAVQPAFAQTSAAEAPASAQPDAASDDVTRGVGDIIVTARRRAENLQSTPLSISAVTAQTLEQRDIVSLVDLSRLAPSFKVEQIPGGVGSAGAAIRGINFGENVPGQDPPLSIYVDGVPLGRLSVAVMELVEPERVEVLRGPQGTLFGRNTTAGAVQIISHTPSDELSGQVRASYGTFNNRFVQARIDSGLLGESGIKLSVAGSYRKRDGTQDNGNQPDHLDPGSETNKALWAKFEGTWGGLKLTVTGDYSKLTGVPENLQIVDATTATRNLIANSPTYGGGTIAITAAPQYSIPSGMTTVQTVSSKGLSATVELDVSPNLTVKSITGLRSYSRNDPSGYGPVDLRAPLSNGVALTGVIGSFNGIYAVDPRQQDQRQVSEELQLLGKVGEFDFVVGAFYFDEYAHDRGTTRLPFPLSNGAAALNSVTPRDYTVDSQSLAGFAQVDWRPGFMDKKLQLTGGIRYTEDTRVFNQTLAIVRTATLKSKNTSFLASANYEWTDDVMTYARFATGYRAGGFNVRSNPPIDPVYQPETIQSFEVGFKAQGFDRRIRLNGAAFINNYNDLQISQFAPPTGVGGGGNQATNGRGRYKGFELELQAVPVDGLTLGASVGYVELKYLNYPVSVASGMIAGCTPITNSAGAVTAQNCGAVTDMVYAPNWTADFSAAYEFPTTSYGKLQVRADYSYRGHTEYSLLATAASPFKNSIAGDPYGLLSARIALTDIPLSGSARGQISLIGKNLTNEAYRMHGIDFGYFATVNYGQRRSFTIEAKLSF